MHKQETDFFRILACQSLHVVSVHNSCCSKHNLLLLCGGGAQQVAAGSNRPPHPHQEVQSFDHCWFPLSHMRFQVLKRLSQRLTLALSSPHALAEDHLQISEEKHFKASVRKHASGCGGEGRDRVRFPSQREGDTRETPPAKSPVGPPLWSDISCCHGNRGGTRRGSQDVEFLTKNYLQFKNKKEADCHKSECTFLTMRIPTILCYHGNLTEFGGGVFPLKHEALQRYCQKSVPAGIFV